ncbi:MAG: hypothetical protein JWO76_2096 [Nocardioides sp.]|nr:hypothetical protein [Nocardioides sp.]
MSAPGLTRWERFWAGPLWAKFAVCIAVGLAFGLVVGTAVTKASGQEPTGSRAPAAESTAPEHRCDPTETPCPQEARWHVKKFRHGKVDGWKHGIPVKRFYIHPAKVKKVWVRKIARALWQRDQARHATARIPYSYRAEAIERYTNLIKAGSCATWAQHYPAWDTHHEVCQTMPSISNNPDAPKEKWMTADEVKAYGAVVLCTGGTVATVVSIPATAGTSATVAAGFGGASCLYGLWASMSP